MQYFFIFIFSILLNSCQYVQNNTKEIKESNQLIVSLEDFHKQLLEENRLGNKTSPELKKFIKYWNSLILDDISGYQRGGKSSFEGLYKKSTTEEIDKAILKYTEESYKDWKDGLNPSVKLMNEDKNEFRYSFITSLEYLKDKYRKKFYEISKYSSNCSGKINKNSNDELLDRCNKIWQQSRLYDNISKKSELIIKEIESSAVIYNYE